MRILFVGDVVGKPGRRLLASRLPELRELHAVDFVIANAENASGGVGLTPGNARELLALGIDVLTLGNHAWDKRELLDAIDDIPQLVRPLNYPPGTPGRGWTVRTSRVGTRVAVINAMGRVFSGAHLDCPFRGLEEALGEIGPSGNVVIVDFHADATSEKVTMGWYLDGRVSAVVGTHTHVQTADAAVLPGGTAYITDVGMTGPWVSSLGMERGRIIERFLTQLPVRFEVATGPSQLNAILIDIDETTGRARSVHPLFEREALDAPDASEWG